MKINLKARLKNKTFVVSVAVLIISFVYTALSLFDIIPKISQDEVMDIVDMGVKVLALLGVFVDPTTEGINDSERAMTYYTDEDVREVE